MRIADKQVSWTRCERCGDLFIAIVRDTEYRGEDLLNLLRGMLVWSAHGHCKRQGECVPCGPSTTTAV